MPVLTLQFQFVRIKMKIGYFRGLMTKFIEVDTIWSIFDGNFYILFQT